MKALLPLFLCLSLFFSAAAQSKKRVAAPVPNKNQQLYKAVLNNDTLAITTLLNKGANIQYLADFGPYMKINLLLAAINHQQFDAAKHLVNKGIDLSWRDRFGSTAILYAAATGNKSLVELILEKGGDIHDDDGAARTVLSAAESSRNKELIDFVKAKLKNQ